MPRDQTARVLMHFWLARKKTCLLGSRDGEGLSSDENETLLHRSILAKLGCSPVTETDWSSLAITLAALEKTFAINGATLLVR